MNNNEARRQFKSFAATWGLEVCGSSNVFKDSGKTWAYVADDSAKSFRQFYDDCEGVFFRDTFLTKDNLKIGSVSRVSPSGLKAYNVALPHDF